MTPTVSPDRLKLARNRAGLSLSQAANAIPAARSGVAAYEAGDTVPGGDLLGRMAHAYGVDVGFFYVHDPEADTASTGCGTNQPRTDRVATITGSGPSRGE